MLDRPIKDHYVSFFCETGQMKHNCMYCIHYKDRKCTKIKPENIPEGRFETESYGIHLNAGVMKNR